MTSSPLKPELAERVCHSLNAALPGASIGQVEIAADHPPLLLLQINQILAAFAFGTDDEAYRELYSGFKRYFLSEGEQWKSLDVSFVYCLPQGAHPTEAFCSQVEADVYFCRKFIVPLSEDISSSLLRLPFLPLAPLAGSPLRPPSAQTLLQRSNVSADLARFLVVQHARGAQGILADCLANKFGDAEPPTEVQLAHEQRQERALNPVSLESLTIQNFRAYRESRTFTFGSAITVLYGPNGFGKTSFFDALDFVVTGSIGRLLPSTATDQVLTKAVRHLDSHDEPCTVTLAFKRGEETHTVVRDLSDSKQAKLDSKEGVARKEVLTMLTGGEGPAADRVENFVSLFRATHLFSQERQELTQDFQLKSELSSDLVSRMLAFEDYVSGIKKTNEVQGFIKGAMERADREVERLEALMEKDRAELSRLEQLAVAIENPAALESEIESLTEDLVATGIDIENKTVDASTLRGCRAQLESRVADLSSQAANLSKALSDLQRAKTFALELVAIESRLARRETALATAEAARVQGEELLRAASLRLAQAGSVVTSVQRACNSLAWVVEMRPEYDKLVKERGALKAKLESATQQDTRLRQEEGLAALARETAEKTLADLNQQVLASSTRLKSLQSLSRRRAATVAASSRLKEVSDAERERIDLIKSAQTLLEQTKETLGSVQVQVARLESEVSAREAGSTEVKSLLAQLRGHATTGTCLLCGVDHGSSDALLARIDARLNQEGQVAEARARLIEKRTEATQLTEQIASHQQRLDDGVARQDALRIEREQLAQVITKYSLDAAALGIVLAEPTWPEEKVDAAVRKEELALATLNDRRRVAARAKDDAVGASENAMAAVRSNAAAAQGAIKALESIDEVIGRLVDDPRRNGASFDIEPEAQLAEIERGAKDLQSAKAAVSEAQAVVDQTKAEVARQVQEATAARKALEDDQRQKGTVRSSISDLNASLAQVGLTPESSDEAVTSLISANSTSFTRIAALRDRAANLEVGLDAVTTAAALTSLRDGLRQHETLIDLARRDRARHEPWARYFEAIESLLSSQQNLATDQFTRQYGPRTAVIQRRLRPVYGFGDVEVSSRSGSISVRVARNGEALRPIDYFSQSQIQTLVLGLFLTACSSQTWSAFSSVMMDDPVTHFDDLNTYALLDLIAGLLQSRDGARQFVISTCDEKLFQLARQKFRHLKQGARFYRFSAIGAEGPLVTEIPV